MIKNACSILIISRTFSLFVRTNTHTHTEVLEGSARIHWLGSRSGRENENNLPNPATEHTQKSGSTSSSVRSFAHLMLPKSVERKLLLFRDNNFQISFHCERAVPNQPAASGVRMCGRELSTFCAAA